MKLKKILAFLIPFLVVGSVSASAAYIYGDHNPKESYDQSQDRFQPLDELVISLIIWFCVPGLLAGGIRPRDLFEAVEPKLNASCMCRFCKYILGGQRNI